MPDFEIKNQEITLNKDVTELDKFVLDTIGIIEEYTTYAIIGGYVSIFFGRSRATEDIDMFIEEISYTKFEQLYKELTNKEYELTISNPTSLYEDYLQEGLSIRIWKKDFPLLNLEVKFAKKPTQKIALKQRITAKFAGRKIYFGQIESQIAYKRHILKSQKDLEDARHLEIVFKNIDEAKVECYKRMFEDELR